MTRSYIEGSAVFGGYLRTVLRYPLLLFLVLLVVVAPAMAIAQREGLYDELQVKKLVTGERLQELSGFYQEEGLIISELNWTPDGKSIIFETRGAGARNSMWLLNASSTQQDPIRVPVPYEKYVDVSGSYKIAPAGEKIIFAAVPEQTDVEANTSRPMNIYTFSLKDPSSIEIVTNNTDYSTYISAFDWVSNEEIIYESRKFEYTEPVGPDTVPIEKWGLWLQKLNGTARLLTGEAGITPGFYSLDASPNGKFVTLAGISNFTTFDITKVPITPLVPSLETVGSSVSKSYPKWSHNSEYVVCWQTQFDNATGPSRGQRPEVVATYLKVASFVYNIDEVIVKFPFKQPSIEMSTVGMGQDGQYIAFAVSFTPFNPAGSNLEDSGIYLVDLGYRALPEFNNNLIVFAAVPSVFAILMYRFFALAHRKETEKSDYAAAFCIDTG